MEVCSFRLGLCGFADPAILRPILVQDMQAKNSYRTTVRRRIYPQETSFKFMGLGWTPKVYVVILKAHLEFKVLHELYTHYVWLVRNIPRLN